MWRRQPRSCLTNEKSAFHSWLAGPGCDFWRRKNQQGLVSMSILRWLLTALSAAFGLGRLIGQGARYASR